MWFEEAPQVAEVPQVARIGIAEVTPGVERIGLAVGAPGVAEAAIIVWLAKPAWVAATATTSESFSS